jgi:hypothetical protein
VEQIPIQIHWPIHAIPGLKIFIQGWAPLNAPSSYWESPAQLSLCCESRFDTKGSSKCHSRYNRWILLNLFQNRFNLSSSFCRPPPWSSGQSSWLQNGDYCVSCEVRTEFICYAEESRPPLWSSGQSSWLQIQRSGLDFRRYQIFSEVVGLERGPLSLVSTIEELLERKSSGSGLESREYGTWNHVPAKVGTNIADKRWSLGRYRSLADSGHGV